MCTNERKPQVFKNIYAAKMLDGIKNKANVR